MAKRLESGVSVTITVAAIADAAKLQIDIGELDESVVVNKSAAAQAPECSNVFFAIAKEICRQRQRVLFDGIDYLIGQDAVFGDDNRQNRPKDLVAHYRVVGRDFDERRRKNERLGLTRTTIYDVFAVPQEPLQALEMTRVDNASHRLRGVFGAIHRRNRLFKRRNQPISQTFFDDDVIGRNARLTCIDELRKCDPPRRRLDIATAHDDTRRFAPQFEHRRREVLGRRMRNDFCRARTPRKKDEIELLRQNFGRFGHAPLDDRNDITAKHLGQMLGDPMRRRRRKLRRLDDRHIARTQSRHERRQTQLNRIIPRANDEHQTARLRHQPRFPWEHKQRRAHRFIARPAIDMPQCMRNLALDKANLRQPCLLGRLPQIRLQRTLDRPALSLQTRHQPPQTLLAKRHIKRRPRRIQLAQFFKHALPSTLRCEPTF